MQSSPDPIDLWYKIENEEEVATPGLLVYPERIEKNILKMLRISGGTDRLRPHVKTHKIPEIIRLQSRYGINKFKCATIAEAEMTAASGGKDILLAYQPVGPNIERLFRLKDKFRETKFSCIADNQGTVQKLSEASVRNNTEINVYLDINVGMNRTGIAPGKEAEDLFRSLLKAPGLVPEGLHVYDGHIREKNPEERKIICNELFEPVDLLISSIKEFYAKPLSVVAGGTPTFPVHALREDIVTSPGTCLLWDYGYSSSFNDMDFLHAAVLMMRIISKPSRSLICLDLGHKAIASEMSHPRIRIFGIPEFETVSHSEEHLVIRTSQADMLNVGDVIYGVPYHICPTVDRHDFVSVVRDGKVTERWNIEARKRVISI